ncbi:MAG: type II secretion system F family protein [Bacilli bacterium]|nr:type II secretion system F family protein [Bacilli bacterium]
MKNNKTLALAHKLYSKETIEKYQKKINLLGYKKTYDAVIFLNIRLLTTILIFFVVLYVSSWGYIVAPIISVIYFYYLPKVMIDKKVEARAESLDGDAMYFFEILTLSLETGRNLKTALEITSNSIDSELSYEFRQALREVRFGKSLNEALENLKLRIPSDTINNIILNISQSNIFGNSIIETMYNQIDYIRDKQILTAKAKISKIPLKVSVISVIFFIPLIMILLLSPVVLQFLS